MFKKFYQNIISKNIKILKPKTFGLLLTGVSYYYYTNNTKLNFDCLFGFRNTKTNYSTIQYPANNPIEDRIIHQELKNIEGTCFAVLDGHGGWQFSEFASKNLINYIDEELKKYNSNINNENIKKSITDGFIRIEEEFKSIALNAYNLGSGHLGKVGSCCLLCLKFNNKLYVANLGDSKGYLFSFENGKIESTKLNRTLNADNIKEQKRLKSEFSDDNIIHCKNKKLNKSCYVKGRIQPTKVFGDFHLKYPEFNNPNEIKDRKSGYYNKIKNFNGPYLTHIPEIREFELNKNHKGIILASDGLWDELSKKMVEKIIIDNNFNKNKIPKILIESSLERISKESGNPVRQLKSIPLGDRRRIHDDISILYYEL